MDSSSDRELNEQIISYLKILEKRISNIENRLNISNDINEGTQLHLPHFLNHNATLESDNLENEIGQFWFAKVGIIILAVGLLFILTFPFSGFPSVFPSAIGYGTTILLVIVSRYLKDSFDLLSRYLFGSAFFLAYFSTLRLYYFSDNPVLSKPVLALLLFIVSFLFLFSAYKRESVYLLTAGVLFAVLSTLIADNFILLCLSFTLLSAFILRLKIKFPRSFLLNGAVLILILGHFWYSIGNHFFVSEAGNVPHTVIAPLFIIVFALILSSQQFFAKDIFIEDASTIAGALFSSVVPFIFLFLVTFSKYKENLTIVHFATSILFITAAIIYWIKYESKYLTFIFSMVSYASLSIALIGYFPKPDLYVWLCWQSFIVVSTAIWFRSKFIIVANFILYLIIYAAYLILAGNPGLISLSFGFVALLSARVLNWQKHRLELRTEIMRIAYLIAAFFIFPYALYHIIPTNYISLSWMMLALFYFTLGNIFKNNKYRWMSLLTLLLTVLYVLVFGAANFDPSFRILTFIILGIILLITSLFYAKKKRKTSVEQK